MRTKIARILKKLKNLPRGRQSIASLLVEARAMRVSYSQFGEDLVVLLISRKISTIPSGDLLMSVRFIRSNIQTQYCSANWAGVASMLIATR